jgi:hypothetical protein
MKSYLPVKQGGTIQYEHTRPVYIVDGLNDLHGPVTGRVRLPHHLDWTPKKTYNIDNEDERRWLYEVVLSGAHSEYDLISYLDQMLLVQLWPTLKLPRYVRILWEAAYPNLASVHAN